MLYMTQKCVSLGYTISNFIINGVNVSSVIDYHINRPQFVVLVNGQTKSHEIIPL